jgi:Protein of unknown function (DUF559)
MTYVRVIELAARQYNRFSWNQLVDLGIGGETVKHRLAAGDWVAVHDGVYGIAPVFDDDHGRWMAATLAAPGSVLSHASAGAAWGWWDLDRPIETVTRGGSGGPRRYDGVLVHYSDCLEGDVTERFGIPITSVPRTLLDQTPYVSPRMLARCVREALRKETTTTVAIMDALTGRHRGRRGSRRLALTAARYEGLPIHRARSGAEVEALLLLRDAGRPMPRFNHKVAGKEADLVWRDRRLIIEIDGGQYHLDKGEDALKEEIWTGAGFTVKRVPAENLRTDLLAIAPNVRATGL